MSTSDLARVIASAFTCVVVFGVLWFIAPRVAALAWWGWDGKPSIPSWLRLTLSAALATMSTAAAAAIDHAKRT